LPWKNATEGFDSAKGIDPGTTANNAWMKPPSVCNMAASRRNQQICQLAMKQLGYLMGIARTRTSHVSRLYVSVRQSCVNRPARRVTTWSPRDSGRRHREPRVVDQSLALVSWPGQPSLAMRRVWGALRRGHHARAGTGVSPASYRPGRARREMLQTIGPRKAHSRADGAGERVDPGRGHGRSGDVRDLNYARDCVPEPRHRGLRRVDARATKRPGSASGNTRGAIARWSNR
jgi:hypothetical protein